MATAYDNWYFSLLDEAEADETTEQRVTDALGLEFRDIWRAPRTNRLQMQCYDKFMDAEADAEPSQCKDWLREVLRAALGGGDSTADGVVAEAVAKMRDLWTQDAGNRQRMRNELRRGDR